MSTQLESETSALAEDTVEMTYREAVNAALFDEMESDSRIYLLGEDVANDGGVFKTNAGLPEAFPGRVTNTPICENTFIGMALGMSVTGLRPVVEVMFSDFLATAADAMIEELPKFRFMTGGQCSVPVTVRSIGGGGGRFGTQHSATGESWFIAFPGLIVASAGTPAGAYGVLRAAIRHEDPVVFFEHKGLYARKGHVSRGEDQIAEVGKAVTLRSGSDVTIVATLLMADRALQAAEELAGEGIDAEVVDPRWLRPFDLPHIHASVARTGRLVVAEEQVHAGGWGATLISSLTVAGVTFEVAPAIVGLPDDVLMPYSPSLEDAIIPSAAAIADAVRGLS
ncbi:MAG TPA: transketolase C-terminal domain-containing protein [Solirubrobacteraceae bacterium]|jgi:pyruvate dehydrogenase E1 component beta subunit|nr:transketolase C-terminal domain-containing protein [Solirubrobacteraceae bacterium]